MKYYSDIDINEALTKVICILSEQGLAIKFEEYLDQTIKSVILTVANNADIIYDEDSLEGRICKCVIEKCDRSINET